VLTLHLHVQPKASLKLRIKAAPIDGKANQQLITFIADEFAASKSACKQIPGESGREIG